MSDSNVSRDNPERVTTKDRKTFTRFLIRDILKDVLTKAEGTSR